MEGIAIDASGGWKAAIREQTHRIGGATQSGINNHFLRIQCSSANKAIDDGDGSMMLTTRTQMPSRVLHFILGGLVT